MRILAIESSCDDTCAAVVEDGRRVLSNVVFSQIKEHIVYGGVVPEIASRMHTEAIIPVIQSALKQADVTLAGIDALAVTAAPGLIGALLVGVSCAKGIALSSGLPLVPVHHLRSHIAANYLTFAQLEPPFLALVVSGGHSHIVNVKGYTEFEVLGRTRDDAAGEVMDKAARTLGLPYPGGVNLDAVSKNGNAHAYEFPHPHVTGSQYDMSFSGLKTYVINLVHTAQQRGEQPEVADVGASFIHAVTDLLVKNTLKAAHDTGAKRIVLAGGVSANSVLRARMESECARLGTELFMPQLTYCGDNAAMVGAQGYYELLCGNVADMSLNAAATMPIEDSFSNVLKPSM